MDDERLFLLVAGLVHNRDAALFSERRIGQHHLVFGVFAKAANFMASKR
jgi:hypothetical protein